VIALVEGFEPDAVALAAILAAEGVEVRLAGPGDGPADDLRPRAPGIRVETHSDLDADPGPADVAYLDVWTPEAAQRVERLAAQGTRLSCLADLLLERWPGRTIGITGTAGKTTTTALVAQILRCAGIDLAVGRGARAGNLWPTGDLLSLLPRAADAAATLLLELTSSHLAFMRHSPQLAAVIGFWPDHLELHGGLDRYRAAKATIVRHQRPGDVLVVNDDDASAQFAQETPAEIVRFSLEHAVAHGAYLAAEGIVLAENGRERHLGRLEQCTVHPANAVAAAAIARAAGAGREAIQQGIATAEVPPWRAQAVATLAGARVIDDGMAATPTKAAATLARLPEQSVVLIAGGSEHAGGDVVHAAAEEAQLLERACDEVARKARLVVLFGPAAARLDPSLKRRDVPTITVDDLPRAVAVAADGAGRTASEAILFAPMFPVTLDDRARFAELIRRLE
jgi:UDP-N-acetylmuramoylalanine--D-glutamate ligase